jgi:tyrosyl-tRNA synthetase
MDLERKLDLITREPTEEVIVREELRQLLETNDHPVAYNGWEPSGLVHLGTGLICAYKMKDFIEAGVRFKAYLAVWHAWINNKLGGDLELIRKAADHFRHAWISLGVPENKVEFIYADKLYEDSDFWRKMILVAKQLTIARTKRTLEIAGRKEADANYVSDFIYTPMQVADIFHMNVNICQLGMDQRKANVVAREVGPQLDFWKPVCVHHHLLQGLTKPAIWPITEENKKEALVSAKMSKSKPETCIFIYDSPEEVRKKIMDAFCPEKIIEYNPIIDICRYIIFREDDNIVIERAQKYGGSLDVRSFKELAEMYRKGLLHPMDLKNAVADKLVKILEPSRRYFEKNKEARELLNTIRYAKATR